MLTQVADTTHVHTSGFVLSNAVIVEGGAAVLLVDPGVTSGEIDCLAADLAARGTAAVVAFSTHPDWDHVLWRPALGDAPRYATGRAADTMARLLRDPQTIVRIAEHLPPEIHGQVPLERLGLLTSLPDGTTHLPWDGPRVRVAEHRAHAPGHAALLVEEQGVLAAGDMLSDVFVPMLDLDSDGDPVEEYLAALDLLEAVAADADVAVPGHGTVARGPAIGARIALDRAYVHALRDGTDPDDPRIGSSAPEGWQWVTGIHQWQAERLGR
ncbi:MBL fold metallo-hydrolase [Cellulomonas wangsupingiae]|uniref:MBL fold metallo-hydrolase n=1 Tax=Cellulomonas wangsupingiae TaxID=2968085 RepID=UPI001D0DEE58|nr:MBL fold metallo-hydrolase [Cellulomonas wangsupingiae]MCM0639369.1 MBL fold metallo-hydrolase [Cellulomonas wangsupingiae]